MKERHAQSRTLTPEQRLCPIDVSKIDDVGDSSSINCVREMSPDACLLGVLSKDLSTCRSPAPTCIHDVLRGRITTCAIFGERGVSSCGEE